MTASSRTLSFEHYETRPLVHTGFVATNGLSTYFEVQDVGGKRHVMQVNPAFPCRSILRNSLVRLNTSLSRHSLGARSLSCRTFMHVSNMSPARRLQSHSRASGRQALYIPWLATDLASRCGTSILGITHVDEGTLMEFFRVYKQRSGHSGCHCVLCND